MQGEQRATNLSSIINSLHVESRSSLQLGAQSEETYVRNVSGPIGGWLLEINSELWRKFCDILGAPATSHSRALQTILRSGMGHRHWRRNLNSTWRRDLHSSERRPEGEDLRWRLVYSKPWRRGHRGATWVQEAEEVSVHAAVHGQQQKNLLRTLPLLIFLCF